MLHVPVLLEETMEVMMPRDGGRYFDGTLGYGGHARAILDRSSPAGELAGTIAARQAARPRLWLDTLRMRWNSWVVQYDAEAQLELAFRQRQEAWAEVRVLRGLLRMCAWCKRIRDPQTGWVPIERYIADHSEADFTHGICPECAASQGGAQWDRSRRGSTRQA